MKAVVTQGVVHVRDVSICTHNNMITVYVDTDQKYPQVSHMFTCGPGRFLSHTIDIVSKSGRGRWSTVELIPEGRFECHLARNSRFVKMEVRYGAWYCYVPYPKKRDKAIVAYQQIP